MSRPPANAARRRPRPAPPADTLGRALAAAAAADPDPAVREWVRRLLAGDRAKPKLGPRH
jgi:hypothetical protein